MTEVEKPSNEFVFRAEDHTYWLRGQPLPSVTEILKACGLILFQADDLYLIRGRVIHRCCELLARGILDWSTVDPRVLPWVESYSKFLLHQRWIANAIEFSSYSKNFLFAGTWDADFTDGWLLDLKTGAAAKWHKLQIGAYWHLDGEHRKTRCANLYLQDDGSIARLVEHSGREGWRDFQTFLNYYLLKPEYVKC